MGNESVVQLQLATNDIHVTINTTSLGLLSTWTDTQKMTYTDVTVETVNRTAVMMRMPHGRTVKVTSDSPDSD